MKFHDSGGVGGGSDRDAVIEPGASHQGECSHGTLQRFRRSIQAHPLGHLEERKGEEDTFQVGPEGQALRRVQSAATRSD